MRSIATSSSSFRTSSRRPMNCASLFEADEEVRESQRVEGATAPTG